MANAKRGEIAGQQLILLKDEAPEPRLAASRVQEEGGRVLHVYGSRVLIEQTPRSGADVEDAIVEEATENLSETERLGLAAWNARQTEEFESAKELRPLEGDAWDLHEPPDAPETVHGEIAADESAELLSPTRDLSAFLIGSVAVGLILVEGPTPDLQFSESEITKVVAEVQEGLTWLAQQEPRANVTWSYDIRTVRVSAMPDSGLSGFEPLERVWRDPAMQQLGFSASFQGVRDYVASLRARLGTDWGYAGFFTKYPLHHFAYASKPRVVMSFGNGEWGPDNIDRVFTHETGHLFGCPDEYSASNCDCNQRFGFLQERNGNCRSCATPFVPCLMEAHTSALCSFTRTHLGWRDSNGSGTFDPLDA